MVVNTKWRGVVKGSYKVKILETFVTKASVYLRAGPWQNKKNIAFGTILFSYSKRKLAVQVSARKSVRTACRKQRSS